MVSQQGRQGNKKRSSLLFFICAGLLFLGIAFSGGLYWYRSQPEQKIIRRFSALLQQIEKKSAESELINLATVKGVVNFFADPADLSFKQRSATLSSGELLQIVSRIRNSVDSIALIPDQPRVIFPDPHDHSMAKLTATVSLEGDIEDMFSAGTIYSVTCIYRKDSHGNYLLESVQVNPLLDH